MTRNTKTRVAKTHPVKVRLIKHLTTLGTYSEAADESIDLYCETYDFYQRMRKELESGDLLMEYTNKAGATNLVKNPLAIEITKTVQVLSNLLKSMGLTPAQMEKPADYEADEFDKF